MMVMMTQISSALSFLRKKLRIQISQQNIVLQIISAFTAILKTILKAL